jgi:hypothetical protein
LGSCKITNKIKSFLSSNEGNLSKSTPLMGSTKRANKTITHYLNMFVSNSTSYSEIIKDKSQRKMLAISFGYLFLQ